LFTSLAFYLCLQYSLLCISGL